MHFALPASSCTLRQTSCPWKEAKSRKPEISPVLFVTETQSLADKLNRTAVHVILVISQIIRKNSKPFRERETARKCLQMAARTPYPEKTAVFQTRQFTNTVDNY
jgi:hypothetical protein